ncbi:MAG TPA: hypothetical protein VIA18_03145, partial [Polyangia bacterium]|nr:hypothetical protein [Polyangia bacterium]
MYDDYALATVFARDAGIGDDTVQGWITERRPHRTTTCDGRLAHLSTSPGLPAHGGAMRRIAVTLLTLLLGCAGGAMMHDYVVAPARAVPANV